MKKQKLKLDELKVQSFVTDFDKEQDQTQEINGGSNLVFCLLKTKDCVYLDPDWFRTIASLAGSCGCPEFTDFKDNYDISNFQG